MLVRPNYLPDWVISDTHFNHANISKYSARCTPLLPTPADVDRAMVYNWTHLVKPEDEIWHLGDLGFFNEENSDFLKDLPGIKKFIRGNHDGKLSPEWLAEHGFEEIPSPSVVYEGVEILFTHYPQRDLCPGQANIHGHQHNNPRANTMSHIDVSVELWNYAPVDAKFIAEKVIWSHRTNSNDAGPRDVPRTVKRRPKR